MKSYQALLNDRTPKAVLGYRRAKAEAQWTCSLPPLRFWWAMGVCLTVLLVSVDLENVFICVFQGTLEWVFCKYGVGWSTTTDHLIPVQRIQEFG